MGARAPFPRNPDEFGDDFRISFDKTAKTYILEDENGEAWEWLPKQAAWTTIVSEEQIAQHVQSYHSPETQDTEATEHSNKKRKLEQEEPKSNKTVAQNEKPKLPNTAIFVSNLPEYADVESVAAYFKRFGMFAESIDTNKPRIKLYNDDDGKFKGEALIVYFRPESVFNACQIGNDDELDITRPNPAGKMKVVPADQSFKAHTEDDDGGDKETAPRAPKTRKPARSNREKAKAKKKAEEMNQRLAEWSDDEEVATLPPSSSRWEKIVVMKYVFTLQELKDDDNLRYDIIGDMTDDAERYGKIKDILIYDGEEDGVVTIKFETAEAAKACAARFSGREYLQRKLVAYVADGSERFNMMSDEERLENFGKALDQGESNGSDDKKS